MEAALRAVVSQWTVCAPADMFDFASPPEQGSVADVLTYAAAVLQTLRTKISARGEVAIQSSSCYLVYVLSLIEIWEMSVSVRSYTSLVCAD